MLIVDDDFDSTEVLSIVLANAGLEVLVAMKGPEALAIER